MITENRIQQKKNQKEVYYVRLLIPSTNITLHICSQDFRSYWKNEQFLLLQKQVT